VTNIVLLLTLRFRTKNICWPKASGGCHGIGKALTKDVSINDRIHALHHAGISTKSIPDAIMPRHNCSYQYSSFYEEKNTDFFYVPDKSQKCSDIKKHSLNMRMCLLSQNKLVCDDGDKNAG